MTRPLLVLLLLAYLSLQCYAQCVIQNRCQAPEVCCADKRNGELCYRPGISHDCVSSTTGGFLLCPPGWLGCDNQCYLTSQHQCINNVLVPVTTPPTPPTTCPANFPCLTGEACCLDKRNGAQCYRPGISHDCVAASNGGFLLCPPGWFGCGSQCFLTSLHQCINDVLVPITSAPPATPAPPACPTTFTCNTGQQCCLDKFNGAQCFDPATFDCVPSPVSGSILCPQNYQVCNDKLHGEQCYLAGILHDCVASTTGGFLLCPPGWLGCDNQCYLTSQHQCINNVLVPVTTPPTPPSPPTTCPANFPCLTGEACCLDKRNGAQCYRPGISHDCVAASNGGFLLCPPGWLGCGSQCFLTSLHQCINNVLVPVTPPPTTCPANFPCLTGESCCFDMRNGAQCYRPGISHDCVASTIGGFLLCPPGWLGCGSQCYLTSQHQCVNNVLVPV